MGQQGADRPDHRGQRQSLERFSQSGHLYLEFGSYRVNDNTKGAVFYYAHNLVTPNWSHVKDLTVIVGNHTFMK